MTVNLPAELAARLAAEAARRQITVDEVLAELVAARLVGADEDPLETFIASGASGRGDLGRQHRSVKADLTKDVTAREL